MSRRVALLAVAALGVLQFAAVAPATAASAATATACQADGNHVALVVDFGDHVDARCLAISAKETGYQALGDRARINGSGLVCAIDGVPATGCGEQTSDGHYAYWSYWHGTAADGWAYSNASPSTRVSASVVEGWRWTPNGSANPNDPQPAWSADPAATCVPATTTVVVASTVPDPSSPPATPATAAAPAGASPSPTSATGVPAEPPSSSSSSSSSPSSSAASASSGQAAARVNDTGGGTGGGSAAGVIVGGGLVAVLAAGALALNRRRSVAGR